MESLLWMLLMVVVSVIVECEKVSAILSKEKRQWHNQSNAGKDSKLPSSSISY
jgi:hypothetical protein